MDRLSHERTILADIASEDRHTAHSHGQGEKCLIHGAHHHRTGDFGKMRDQIEAQSLSCSRKCKAMHRQHQHQHDQC